MANTTSGTVTFDKTFAIDDIIEEAYERIGMQGTSGYQLKTAKRSLNILFQEWGNRGIHFWEVGDTNIDFVEGQATYTFYRATGDGASSTTAGGTTGTSTYGLSDVLECTYRQNYNTTSESDSSMTKVDRSTYSALANKLSKGTPNQFWVQRFIDKTTVTFYPTPNSTAASNYAHIYFVKRIQDAGDYTNASDVPYRFVPCMSSGLAFYLSQKYNPELTQNLKLLYEDELARALSEDGSPSSSYITPKTYFPSI
jgi:hypothetical protein|tara:strand:+ start:104 stop:865 length:762 start_codon:yes stop_codon:yes gene_type:complete